MSEPAREPVSQIDESLKLFIEDDQLKNQGQRSVTMDPRTKTVSILVHEGSAKLAMCNAASLS